MAAYRITLDFSGLLNGLQDLDAQLAEHIQQAIEGTAEKVREEWADAVMKAPGIWEPIRKAYAQSITVTPTGRFSVEVSTPLDIAEKIETGQPARDLKRMLRTSLKVRTSQQGKRYLIIPFRHNVPGRNGGSGAAPQMPRMIYRQAKQLAPSRITGMGRRVSGTGAYDIATHRPITVAARKYAWGGALDASAGSRYAGMRRFDTSSGKAKSSAYLTFRVMSEDSSGWIVPAKPGMFILKGVAETMTNALQERLQGFDVVAGEWRAKA